MDAEAETAEEAIAVLRIKLVESEVASSNSSSRPSRSSKITIYDLPHDHTSS